MAVIINSENLSELKVGILRRSQKMACNHNYYFTPNIAMHLYNAKVVFIKPTFIVFEFDKSTHLSLLLLMRRLNDKLQMELKINCSELFDKEIYDIVSEKETTFSIRCFLPTIRGKYNIICQDPDENGLVFKLPRLDCIFKEITIEIKNVWQTGDKRGFNIELKSVNYN
jgi:hypothetical protein